ncbi:MAG TPA: peptide-methionine (S)-S-oxide reductase MsrA [Thermoanaerobaculia bacterium]|jgi:peptide-methionine (S)-S-oxide reductase|nr:peptide-methionine (S)-S-oxide reductase MsrA [Thermoanaerobaculia bacterium]
MTACRCQLPLGLVVAVVLLAACGRADGAAAAAPAAAKPAAGRAVATFAMGCFWCAEDAFEGQPGVLSVTSGYTGGHVRNPSYEAVSAGGTGHFESIEVVYDPRKTSYEKLLATFWHNVDPLDAAGQFCDQGEQYRSAVFVHGDEQRRAAEASKQQVASKLGRAPATQIVDAGPFYAAEAYHQDFARKNPLRYHFYKTGCGREARLRQVWGGAAGGGG